MRAALPVYTVGAGRTGIVVGCLLAERGLSMAAVQCRQARLHGLQQRLEQKSSLNHVAQKCHNYMIMLRKIVEQKGFEPVAGPRSRRIFRP